MGARRGVQHAAQRSLVAARQALDGCSAAARQLLAENDVPELAVLVDSAAVSAILWNTYRTWVKHGDLRMIMALLVIFSVRMAVHKRVKTWHLRPLINAVVNARAKDVTVSKEDGELLARLWILIKQDVVISHAGEVQNHLVNLCLAISADRNDLIGNAVQHLNNALWCVVCRKIVARAVIEQISQKQNVLWLLLLDDLHELLAIVGSAVNI